MESSESLIISLREFGLTEYESKTYLKLSSSRSSVSAFELSRVSGVPYTKLYSVLSSLNRKGLVEIKRGKPSVYKTVNPEKALGALRERNIARLSEAYENAVSSLRKMRSGKFGREDDRKHGASWNIDGKRNVINKLLEEVESSRKSVKIVFSDLDVLGKPILNKIMHNNRELTLKLLVSQDDRKLLEDVSKDVQTKYSDAIKSRYALFDDQSCLMMSVDSPDYWTGVFETCRNCNRQALEHFDLAWKAANQIS
jgi:HTH-type transcriptional regulator, sugar sensing transcriptional regulator